MSLYGSFFKRVEIKLTRLNGPLYTMRGQSPIVPPCSIPNEKQCHVVFVHKVDYRMRPKPTIRKVVKFSKSCHALFQVTNLRLSTPDYYRDEEDLTTGIADPYDSMLNKDASPWTRRRYSTLVSK